MTVRWCPRCGRFHLYGPSPTRKCLVHMEDDANHCRGCAADRKAVS